MMLCATVVAPLPAQEPARGVLYRMSLFRAAPGKLLDLIAALKTRVGDRASAAGPAPLMLRHAQGDHWDIMVLAAADEPLYLRDRALASAELIAWQQDEFVRGPDVRAILGFQAAGLYHVEMFVSLATTRTALVKEREMENAYLRTLGRPTNAIFTRELGAEWDVFTIAAYRNWKHYAERDDIPPERAAAAARAAGFDSDDRIGPYLRSLINTHHDSLVTPVR